MLKWGATKEALREKYLILFIIQKKSEAMIIYKQRIQLT